MQEIKNIPLFSLILFNHIYLLLVVFREQTLRPMRKSGCCSDIQSSNEWCWPSILQSTLHRQENSIFKAPTIRSCFSLLTLQDSYMTETDSSHFELDFLNLAVLASASINLWLHCIKYIEASSGGADQTLTTN